MRFGAHISVSGGYLKALDYAESVGCECVQIFAKSPRQWRASALDAAGAQQFAEARIERGFGPLYTHTSYLINLASESAELYEKSVVALADELVRGSLLHAAGVVTHVGAAKDGDVACASRIGAGIRRAYELAAHAGADVRLLLENTAGAGSTYGGSFEQLAAALAVADMPADRLGVCFDTCHAFAYGFALESELGWSETVAAFDEIVGLERLGLIHANDCLFERGSHKDRHAWIGDGYIGESGFEAMVCTPELTGVSVVTEMPGEVPEKDRENIRRLSDLRKRCVDR